MRKKQFSFFATQEDLMGVLTALEAKISFCFASTDVIGDEAPSIHKSFSEIVDLSIARFGDPSKEKAFLLVASDARLQVRKVEQRRGGEKYFLDQLSTPESVVLRPGGVFGESECIVAGQVGTVSEDKWSVDLYKILLAEFKSKFTRIKSFYVGKIASKMLGDGIRLTTNIKAPPEYDLQY